MNINCDIKYDNVLLRPILQDDIESIRVWRNDSSNNYYLSNVGEISKAQQQNWFNKYLNSKDEITFAIIETRNLCRMVGTLSLYNIKKNVAEFGRMLIGDKSAHGIGVGKKSLAMLLKFGFEVLKLSSICGCVNKNNMPALVNYTVIGFRIVGEQESKSFAGGMDFIIEIDYDRFKKINDFLENIVFNYDM